MCEELQCALLLEVSCHFLREDVLHLIDMSCPGELWEEMIFGEGVRWCYISYWEMLCLYMYGEVFGVEVNIVSSRFDDINEKLGIKERVATDDYLDN